MRQKFVIASIKKDFDADGKFVGHNVTFHCVVYGWLIAFDLMKKYQAMGLSAGMFSWDRKWNLFRKGPDETINRIP